MAQRRKVRFTEDERHAELKRKSPETFGPFKKGDFVKVDRERGIFTFMYATVDDDGVASSYTVYGGLKGRGKIRTFLPDRCTPDRARQRLRKKEIETKTDEEEA
jgi:hypothetical protein